MGWKFEREEPRSRARSGVAEIRTISPRRIHSSARAFLLSRELEDGLADLGEKSESIAERLATSVFEDGDVRGGPADDMLHLKALCSGVSSVLPSTASFQR